jgi:hypothetical protein
VQELFSTDGAITQMFHPDIIWVEITELSPQPVPRWSAVESKSAAQVGHESGQFTCVMEHLNYGAQPLKIVRN